MTSPALLALIATNLETLAGASVSANPNPSGYWKRIAAAAESLAGASTSGNSSLSGYAHRAAVALDAFTAFGGSGYNSKEEGYLAWIVDALEFYHSTSTVGSLESRFQELSLLPLEATGVDFGTHKYWQFQINSMNSDTYVGWLTINMFDTNDVAITTTGQTYSEGGAGTQGAHGAAAPFDGNPGTYFLRSGAPCYVQIQFASAVSPGRFEFLCSSVARAAIDFTIRSSDDGVTFTDALLCWEPSYDVDGSARSFPQDFSGGKVKAIGFEVTETQGAGLASMNEAEFHATVSGADLCTGGAAWAVGNAVSGTGTTAAGLFDNSTGTVAFAHANLPATVYYAFPTPIAVPVEFTLKDGADPANAWKDFKVFSAIDKTLTKTYLKTIAGENWASGALTKTYTIP